MNAPEKYRAKKGLEGVIFDTTSVSHVLPEEKSLFYRGYAVHELADQCCFEEVAFLLLHGELPTAAQLTDFAEQERSARALPVELQKVIEQLPAEGHPMDAVRTAVSFLGMLPEFRGVETPESALRKGVSLLAKIPTVIAAVRRIGRGEAVIPPRADLSLSENFFQMCFGEVPQPEVVGAFDGALTLYAEHGFNASTFTARVIVSTQSDLPSAVCGAIGALKGNLHGGANEAVMHMLLEIDSPDRAQSWIDNALESKAKVMGFGHRLYRLGDSRVPKMTAYREQMAKLRGGERWEAISRVLEETMVERKNIHPNLDFPAGPVYYLMGFEIPLYTPIFVIARVVGWTAHVVEQITDNRLVRPSADYVGAAPRAVTPLALRG
ncbi:bifunctional 2-methylcitrate synthase/citrate synthase [Botrimarina hoheduenensis]|uniref:Citrate synthase n=1 Tax=Botrimarina hoheduenensis TaxID=2528000 RepID=A0A5C5VNK3_9BACT|nr:bifunctional 2-methylcitrate synthase/citrate synthase [Botrimarina hoheduenensis]TWT40168.1 2-methylcitrate synthase 2 [Botrimarina hoheduenensis]